MHSKSHCVKGAARAQNRGQAVGVRRTQYSGLAEPTQQTAAASSELIAARR